MKYERGSEWRRWDLHIHTPETKKNDNYEGQTMLDKWNKFYQDLSAYNLSADTTKKVSVLGITDYYSIENFRKVVSDNTIKDKFDLILPNIEMRITPVSSESPINIHFICNPDIVPQLDTKLFSQLVYEHSNGIPYHATNEDFIKLGKLQNNDLNEREAYKVGLNQFVVDFSKLKAILKNDKELRENTIIVLSNKSTDGASGIGNSSCQNANSSLSTIRDDLYCFTDMIFSSNQSDVNYFLGKGSLSKTEIIKKYGKLIPCIHGCDAHENSKILKPDNDRYCWIKADCTFEGLKQVIFEPEERVKIQATYPDVKHDYSIIDKVIITNPDFSTNAINFNENLTCFIGGKSTGKSIILNNMAMLIDDEQYQAKTSENFIINGMKVYWKDGYISDGVNEKRNICYIPQTYLNNLTDKPDEQTEIDDIIQNIILQDEQIKEKFVDFNKQLDSIKSELDKEIYDLLKTHSLKIELEKDIKENGNVDAIEKEISKLQKERDFIVKSLEINEEDLSKYDELKKNVVELDNKIKIKNKNIVCINEIQPTIEICQNLDDISDDYSNEIKIFFELEKEKIILGWTTEKKKLIEELNHELGELIKTKTDQESDLKEKEKIIEKTEELKNIVKTIKKEEEKKSISETLQNSLQDASKTFDELFNKVIHKIAIFDCTHNEFATYVNQRTKNIDNTMEFIAEGQFRFAKFDEKVRSVFNNKKLRAIYTAFDDGHASDIDENSLRKLVTPLFTFEGANYLKGNITIEEALRAILSNWYNIVYNIKLDNDRIEAMSPGKKALVLLKLLINLAKSDCPILIDQPEDDLDNRSIYDELVQFLKEKKYDRQIIIVTHNANIVLGSDAEEIIVANQKGNNSPNEMFRFEYRSGSIENNNKIYNNDGTLKSGILNCKGIQDHICEILEGGKEAFKIRKQKYELQ